MLGLGSSAAGIVRHSTCRPSDSRRLAAARIAARARRVSHAPMRLWNRLSRWQAPLRVSQRETVPLQPLSRCHVRSDVRSLLPALDGQDGGCERCTAGGRCTCCAWEWGDYAPLLTGLLPWCGAPQRVEFSELHARGCASCTADRAAADKSSSQGRRNRQEASSSATDQFRLVGSSHHGIHRDVRPRCGR